MTRGHGPSTAQGELLHESRFLRGLRILQTVALAVGGVVALLALTPFVALLFTVTESAASYVAVVALLLACLVLLGLFGLLMWRSLRMAMRVSTRGIEVRGLLRDHWIPWEQVARVETSDHWYWRRATRIVTTDGRRVDAVVTAYQNLFFRGEPYDAAARDPRVPQLPTRLAIDAHRRSLRGEFGTGGPDTTAARPG